ncbi:MAG: TonB-dependent receptor [Kangiellaceae bacterium]|nr:TonB-dependent receptor [Kangiellaceae bacterium]
MLIKNKVSPPFRKKYQVRVIEQIFTGALVLALSMPGAIAQESIDSNRDADDDRVILVTGSNIRGVEDAGAAVLTIDDIEIAKSGRASIADLIRELPSNLAGGVGMADEAQSDQDSGAANANLSGGQGVNLRGLGALSTLVLVNGRRLAASGQFGDFVDIANLPASAIERVEILQDGASAIYGSDAVGGVVNFILKRDVDRPVTSLRFGTATEGGGDETVLNHLHGFDWDTGNAVIGFEYYSKTDVKATDRDVYKNGSDFSRFGGVNWAEYSAHASATANIFLGGAGSDSAPVGASVPVGMNNSLTMSDLTLHTDGSGNTYNVFDQVDILPAMERTSLFGSFDQDFDQFTMFGDFVYTDRTSDYDLGYSRITRHSVPTTSPFYISGLDASLTGPDGSIAFGKVLTDRVNSRESSVTHFNAQIGLEFELTDSWSAEIVASAARDEQQRYRETLRNPSGNGSTIDFIGCALGHANPACIGIGAIAWNPFSTDSLSDAQIEQYYGYEDLKFDSEVTQLSVKADGALFSLPAGDVLLAVGLDYREEVMDGYVRFNTVYPTTSEGPYEKTKRQALSSFIESYIPVTDSLNFSIAGRYEDFSGTGNYSTFNPKVGFNFDANDSIKLRGSWGTSFHAPAMRFENDSPQPLPGGNSAFTLNVSRFAPCDTDLIQVNGIIGTPGAAGEQCSFSLIIQTGGAGEGILKPEESESWTLGADFEFESVPGLRMSLGYFDIQVDDRIQRIQSGQLDAILEDFFATGGGPFSSALTVNPSVEVAQAVFDSPKFLFTFGPPIADSAADIAMIVNATQLNIASLKETGFDFSANYDFRMSDIEFSAFVQGTYLTEYSLKAAPGLASDDQLGKYSSFGSPVALRSKQGLSFAKGPIDGRLSVNYTDGYECDTCYVPSVNGAPVISSSSVKIDAWITVDLGIGWDFSDNGDGSSRLNLQVNNLLGEDAPFLDGGTGVDDAEPAGYDPSNHTIIGRTVSLQLTKEW